MFKEVSGGNMDNLNERVESQKKLQELIKKKAEVKQTYHNLDKERILLKIEKAQIGLKISQVEEGLKPVIAELDAIGFKIQELRSAIDIAKDEYFSNKP